MNPETKELLEQVLDKAKASLLIQDGYIPSLIVGTGSSLSEEAPLTLQMENREEELKLIKSSIQGADFSVLVFTAETASIPTEKEEEYRDIPIKEMNSYEAIMAVFHTREKSYIRTIPYKRLGEQNYWFSDTGWLESTDKLFPPYSNPFLE